MKKLVKVTAFALMVTMLNNVVAYGEVGDSSFFGGISEGRKLPKTTETLIASVGTSKTTSNDAFVYKEMVFLDGEPIEVDGILTKKVSGSIVADFGTYKETHTIKPNKNGNLDSQIDRTIVFTVNYRKEKNQTIKDYEVDSWSETITTPNKVYVLDSSRSHYGISVIEDKTAGVVYYKGNSSQYAYYVTQDAENADDESVNSTVNETIGTFYGYVNAWSSTETHRINGTITKDDWQLQYQVRPSVNVFKDLQYDQNEPTAISFSGNYKEVMQNNSGLKYDIFVKPLQLYNIEDSGAANVTTYNTFEQLIAPNVDYLKGHWAESDIKKLFSMQILEGNTKYYQPNQAITRGEFITALVKAMKLPLDKTPKTKKGLAIVNIVFPDVTEDKGNYKEIMAAYKAGIALGRSNGYFYNDDTIERQEVITTMLRAIGLENLGLDPTPMTTFTDDYEISDWAKSEIYAAERIGLIVADKEGRINPKELVNKAEAAAVLNRLIDYMRTELKDDYADHIVNYSN
jgi:N-acetylmuramoyl-L-alanine amidase